MADLLRISLVGEMPNGEEWSVNPVFAIGGDFGESVTAAQATAIATAIAARAVPTSLLATNVTTVKVNGARVEARMSNGDLVALGEALKATPSPGTASASHGFSAATVVSLRTGLPGASGRGRLYWPATGVLMNNLTLRVDPSAVAGILAGMKTYLSGIDTDIQSVLTGAATLCVWSRKTGALSPVNAMQVGDVLDTQRRRRDVIVESYQSVAYP
jgi:hypothetical protein